MYLTHITRDGERWDALAAKYYGNALDYERIVAANPHVPLTAIISAGQTLAIPVVEQSDVLEDLPPWLK